MTAKDYEHILNDLQRVIASLFLGHKDSALKSANALQQDIRKDLRADGYHEIWLESRKAYVVAEVRA